MMSIILASASPRRRQLLAQAGYEFEVLVSEADEHIEKSRPEEMVKELSRRKAKAVVDALDRTPGKGDSILVIGADTIVVHKGVVLGKPADEEEAFSMLRSLSADTHQVYTGETMILLKDSGGPLTVTFAECTDVEMRELSDQEIRDYIASGDPMDKAGAYGIQGKAAVFVSGIHGDYYNVVGLPICRTVMEIDKLRKYAE